MFETFFGAEMPLAIRFALAAFIFLVLAGVIFGVVRLFNKAKDGGPPPVQIAHITEHIMFSGGGAFAVLMLVLFNIALGITFIAVPNVLQQIVAVLSWIGWNILWGIGAIIGRRRTYMVYRDAQPTERQEPRFEPR